MVRAAGIEPALLYRNKILSLACLPIPPRPQQNGYALSKRASGATIFERLNCALLSIDLTLAAHYLRLKM